MRTRYSPPPPPPRPCQSRRSRLTSSGSSDESKVVKLRHLVLHHGGRIPQFGAIILVISGSQRDDRAVRDVAERDDLEGHR